MVKWMKFQCWFINSAVVPIQNKSYETEIHLKGKQISLEGERTEKNPPWEKPEIPKQQGKPRQQGEPRQQGVMSGKNSSVQIFVKRCVLDY